MTRSIGNNPLVFYLQGRHEVRGLQACGQPYLDLLRSLLTFPSRCMIETSLQFFYCLRKKIENEIESCMCGIAGNAKLKKNWVIECAKDSTVVVVPDLC